jgi:hypothetical protein
MHFHEIPIIFIIKSSRIIVWTINSSAKQYFGILWYYSKEGRSGLHNILEETWITSHKESYFSSEQKKKNQNQAV